MRPCSIRSAARRKRFRRRRLPSRLSHTVRKPAPQSRELGLVQTEPGPLVASIERGHVHVDEAECAVRDWRIVPIEEEVRRQLGAEYFPTAHVCSKSSTMTTVGLVAVQSRLANTSRSKPSQSTESRSMGVPTQWAETMSRNGMQSTLISATRSSFSFAARATSNELLIASLKRKYVSFEGCSDIPRVRCVSRGRIRLNSAAASIFGSTVMPRHPRR